MKKEQRTREPKTVDTCMAIQFQLYFQKVIADPINFFTQ